MLVTGSIVRTWIYDGRIRAAAYQIACVAAVCALAWFLWSNAAASLARQNIATGFGYLWREAGFAISQSPIAYEPADTYARALLVGILNTIRVSAFAVIGGTLFGVLIGVARLSPNPLLAQLSKAYIETLRNVPLLLFLFLWYAVIVTLLPPVREAVQILPHAFLSNSGLVIPSVDWSVELSGVTAALMVGGIFAIAIARRATAQRIATGVSRTQWRIVAIAALAPAAFAIALLRPELRVSWPELGRFRIVGGAHLTPEYAALLLGLALSASASVAEIVRSGIAAVNRAQTEASRSLGLSHGMALRLVILPQALRVIIPPLTSTYLSVFKNSSLAIAIGYPDLVMVSNNTMNQTGQAIEPIALFMLAYLSFSLAISLLMNWYNARVALRER